MAYLILVEKYYLVQRDAVEGSLALVESSQSHEHCEEVGERCVHLRHRYLTSGHGLVQPAVKPLATLHVHASRDCLCIEHNQQTQQLQEYPEHVPVTASMAVFT
jgi:hypothetical protein